MSAVCRPGPAVTSKTKNCRVRVLAESSGQGRPTSCLSVFLSRPLSGCLRCLSALFLCCALRLFSLSALSRFLCCNLVLSRESSMSPVRSLLDSRSLLRLLCAQTYTLRTSTLSPHVDPVLPQVTARGASTLKIAPFAVKLEDVVSVAPKTRNATAEKSDQHKRATECAGCSFLQVWPWIE